MQQAALEAAGIGGTYSARQVDAAGMTGAVDQIRRGDLDGANVTMPHKPLAATLVDNLSEGATRAGAVNTIVPDGQRLMGYLTDVAGVRQAIARAGFPGSGPVLVLGAGGAATAALLATEGRPLRVAARRPGAGRQLLQRLEIAGSEAEWGTPWEGATVVNATPIGMAGERLPDGIVESAAALLDMVYGDDPSPAVAAAHNGGIPVADGLDMLIAQGAESFRLWTGREPPVAAMRAALFNHRKG